MMSQLGKPTISIHILPNISQSKDYQKMKLGQLREYNKRNIFLQKLYRQWDRETYSRPFFFSKKAEYEVKESGLLLSFNIFQQPSTLNYWSRDMLNFNFSRKGLGIVSPTYSVYDFIRKFFLCYML